MKTLGARLALWYCLVSTLTLFALLAAGYYLLNQHLDRSLTLLTTAEEQRGHLNPENTAMLHVGARQVMEGYAQVGLVLVCLCLLVSLITGLGLSNLALRPLRLIQETANRIRSDNLSERIPVSEIQDEIASLAILLNEMFDRLESSFHQVRRFSAEASHELKTPLSLIRLQAEKLLTEGGLTPDQEECVQVQLEEMAHLNQIIEDLLFLSRAEAQAVAMNLQPEDPAPFLRAFAADARLLAEHAGLRFEETYEGGETVHFDRKWIRQVLLNLVTNSLKVAPAGSLLSFASEFTVDTWHLTIEDEGPGVPAEKREHIFERFVQVTEPGASPISGSGLGLAICRSILDLHHGSIRAEEGKRKGGLRVICEIPLRSPEPAGQPVFPTPAADTDLLD